MEHEDGPKKVKAVLLPSIIAVSALPHAGKFSILKLQLESCVVVEVAHTEQTGKLYVTGGDDGELVVSAGEVMLPSKLYSFLQLVINNKDTITRKHSTFFILLFSSVVRMDS